MSKRGDDLPKYRIYAEDTRAAARLAADMDLHLSQWYHVELFVEQPFAEEVVDNE